MKKNLFLILLAFILLSCIQKTSADKITGNNINPNSINKKLALKDYQHDFNQMFRILIKKHPQPYTFIDEDSLKNLANLQYSKITDSTTIWEFLWICQPVIAAIKCGHTGIWSERFVDLPKSCFFPMNVKYVNSKLYIIDARENADKLSPGDEILTINRINVEKLRKEIFQHLFADGLNETRNHEVTNLNFFWLCPLKFGFPASYTVTVKHNGNTEIIKLVNTEVYNYKNTFLDNCSNKLCFDMNHKSNTAIITIRSFAYYKKDFQTFTSFIDSCFYQIKENNIENLIIDLRNNEGGDPFCGSYLVQYIADKPFTYFHKDVFVYRDLKKTVHPDKNRFTKKPYILINGLCFSTTGHFCSIVKENNFGIFVGDETGGTYTCNDNGKIFTLKNTKLLLRVARNTYKTNTSSFTNKHGIVPDYYVIPDIDNILNNSDTVLNYTLNLIEKK